MTVVAMYRLWVYSERFGIVEIFPSNPFSAGLGEEQIAKIHPFALNIRSVASGNKVLRVKLGDALRPLVSREFISEFIYPIELDQSSRFVIDVSSSPPLAGCTIVDRAASVSLYFC